MIWLTSTRYRDQDDKHANYHADGHANPHASLPFCSHRELTDEDAVSGAMLVQCVVDKISQDRLVRRDQLFVLRRC